MHVHAVWAVGLLELRMVSQLHVPSLSVNIPVTSLGTINLKYVLSCGMYTRFIGWLEMGMFIRRPLWSENGKLKISHVILLYY